MLNCPFCGQDYSDVGLREGRCPYCGGVLAWEEHAESGAIEPHAPAHLPPEPPEQPAPPAEQPSAEAAPEPPRRRPAAPPPPGGDTVYLPPPRPAGEQEPAGVRDASRDSLGELPPPRPAAEAGTAGRETPAEQPPGEQAPVEPPAGEQAWEEEAPLEGDTATPQDLVSATIDERVLTDSDLARMTAMWQKSFTDDDKPNVTIKADARRETISESKLVIQTHALREITEEIPAGAERPDYELLEVIGEGGVGVVYAARQASIDRTVAVKMLRPEIMGDEQHQQKFLSEAVVTGDLDHPNIVPIYDLGSNQSGALFYSMKRVQGTPWNEAMRGRTLTQNLDILMKVCDAIAFAHSRGVIHRDLKPENIMLGEFGEVLVMDWGIALSTSVFLKHGSISKSSSMGGTPAYMAPEMATGPMEAIDEHSDVYLLGGILYEILTGQTPHYGDSVTACLKAAAENKIRPTNQRGELMEIALKALATDPGDRFPSVVDFQGAIREYQSHSESVVLSTRAEEELKTAEETGDYQDYARAMFAFQEAYELWPGNDRARRGITRARLAYARHALRQEDYDLGISLLHADDPAHAGLLRRLKAGRAQRNAQERRVRHLRGIAAALVLAMLAGSGVALYVISDALRREEATSQSLAERSAELSDKEALATYSASAAKKAEAMASDNADRADTAREMAEENAKTARNESDRAIENLNQAQRSAYRAEIAAAKARIDENQEASDILQELRTIAPELRHIEWGRLHYLAEGLAEERSVAGLVEAVAATPDGRFAVAGCRDGRAYVVDFGAPARGAASRETGRRWVLRHDSPIHAVAIDPSGRRIALAGGNENGNISFWNLDPLIDGASPEEARLPAEDLGEDVHRGPIQSVAFSRANPGRILTAARDGSVHLWNYDPASVSAGAEKIEFRGHADAVWQAAFSPDEKWLVTAGEDGTVRVWETATGWELQRYEEHTGPVRAAAFVPGSNPPRVASAGSGGEIRLWTTNVNRVLELAAEQRDKNPREVFITARREEVRARLGLETRGAVDGIREELADVEWNEVVLECPASPRIWALDFSEDGRLLLSAGSDNTIRIWDPTWTPDRRLPPGDEGLLTTLRREARARFTRQSDPLAERGKWLRSLRGHGSVVKSAVFAGLEANSEGQNLVVLSGAYDETMRRWTLAASEREAQFRTEQPLNDVVLTPDGRFLVAAAENGVTTIFDTTDKSLVAELSEGHRWLASKAFYCRRDGQPCLITAAGDNSVCIWDAQSHTQIARKQDTGYRGLLALSTDENGEARYFATGTLEHTVRVWDARTLDLKCELLADYVREQRERLQERSPDIAPAVLESRLPEVTAVAFSPDGSVVFIGDREGMCHLLKVADQEPVVAPFRGHFGEMVNAAAFTPWGDLLTAGDDGTVAQWDPSTGAQIGNRWNHQLELRGGGRTASREAPVKQMGLHAVDGAVHVVTAAPLELIREEGSDRPRPNGSRLRRAVLRKGQSIGDVPPAASVVLEADRVNSLTFSGAGGDSFDVLIACSQDAPQNDPVHDYLQVWSVDPNSGAADGGEATRVWPDSDYRGPISWALFAPNQDAILTVGGKGAWLWSRERGRRITSYRPHAALHALDIAPPGIHPAGAGQQGSAPPEQEPEGDIFYLLTAGEDNAAKIWRCEVTGQGGVEARAIARFDWGTAGQRDRMGHTRPINSARFFVANDQLRVVTAGDDGFAKIWRQNAEGDWDVLHSFSDSRQLSEPLHAALVSPNGGWLAAAGEGHITLWKIPAEGDAASPAPFKRLNVPETAALCLDFSHDGRWLAAGCSDFLGRVWDLRPLGGGADEPDPAGELPLAAEIRGHAAPLRSIAFSDDGQRIVTGSGDSTVRIWDTYPLWEKIAEQSDDRSDEPQEEGSVPRLNELLNLSEHQGDVNTVRFTADGRHLVSAGSDGRAIIWYGSDVDPAIRLSDRATTYMAEPEGVVVDEHLIVMAPTDLRHADGPYQVIISIQQAAGQAAPGTPTASPSFTEQLTLDDLDKAIKVTRPEEAAARAVVEYLVDPVREDWIRVGVMQRRDEGHELLFEIDPQTTGAALQQVLRHVRYKMEGVSGDMARTIHFLLLAPGETEPSARVAEKRMNIIASDSASATRPVATVDAGLHHLIPAGLDYRAVVGEARVDVPSR